MRFRGGKLAANRGALLIMIGATATVWLAATKQLTFYIHPRYTGFSVVASLFGLWLAAWTHNDGDKDRSPKLLPSLLLLAASFVLFLVIKPGVLSSKMANQRGLNASITTSEQPSLPDPQTVQLFVNNDFSQLSVREWATLLGQTNDQAFFAGKRAALTGFITADESDPTNVFFVSRFVIRCCAVDAQPVGVPVYMPNWQNTFKPDDWVTTTGTFTSNPSAKSAHRIVLKPNEVAGTAQPKDPYVY